MSTKDARDRNRTAVARIKHSHVPRPLPILHSTCPSGVVLDGRPDSSGGSIRVYGRELNLLRVPDIGHTPPRSIHRARTLATVGDMLDHV